MMYARFWDDEPPTDPREEEAYLEHMEEARMTEAQTLAVIAAILMAGDDTRRSSLTDENIAEFLETADVLMTGARMGWKEQPYPWTPEGTAEVEKVAKWNDDVPF